MRRARRHPTLTLAITVLVLMSTTIHPVAAQTPTPSHSGLRSGIQLSSNGASAPTGTQPLGLRRSLLDSWQSINQASVQGRQYHTAVWTGAEAIMWGGHDSFNYLDTGIRYSPSTNTYTNLPQPSPITGSPPTARQQHTAVWTDTEMIIWGGETANIDVVNNGAAFNPVSGTWRPLPNAPIGGRALHAAVWTGSSMIVWGGATETSFLNDGASYSPATNTWTLLPPAPLSPRQEASAAWTGHELVIWGGWNGNSFFADGARYIPSTNSWSMLPAPPAPVFARSSATAVWTGNEVIIWGGGNGASRFGPVGRYNPTGNTWSPMSTVGQPTPRAVHAAVYTDQEMLIWGGSTGPSIGGLVGDGARYAPATDSWTAMTLNGAPSVRQLHTGVWSGSEMIVWGGSGSSCTIFGCDLIYLRDGGRYRPVDSLALTLTAAPTSSATPTVTPTPTATSLLTATTTPTPIAMSSLAGAVLLQGRPDPPNPALLVKLSVRFSPSVAPGPILTAEPFADASGHFSAFGIPAGVYDIEVKHQNSISVKANAVSMLPAAVTVMHFGRLPTGDANGDNLVDIVDFSLLRSVFGASTDCATSTTPGACADFDATAMVDIVDFSLLRSNFGRVGPVPIEGVPDPCLSAFGTVAPGIPTGICG